jgi:hypothetical protein
MNNIGPWHTEDYEQLSWHDVEVHGLRLDRFNESRGAADLTLDIDYILDWIEKEKKIFFSKCRAELRFHEIFGLRMDLDYTAVSAGMCPFSVEGINREPIEFETGYRSFQWEIPINWPRGSLEFQSPGFTLTLTGNPVDTSQEK